MKILLFDIETSPFVGYSWEKYETNIVQFIRESYILSFSYKWLGGKTNVYALPDFPLYKRDKHNDRELVKKLWELFDKADVLVAHNGNSFDIKRANARFSFHKLKPPTAYKTIDTLKILRKHFSFPSNKLNDVSKTLGFGQKVEHEGFPLWVKCIDGDLKAWKRMKRYNKQDVELLTKLYLYLLPWIEKHPNRNVYDGTENKCPNCGGGLKKAGLKYTATNTFQTYRCLSCGARPTDRKPLGKSSVKVV